MPLGLPRERAYATFEYPVPQSIKATSRYGLGLGLMRIKSAVSFGERGSGGEGVEPCHGRPPVQLFVYASETQLDIEFTIPHPITLGPLATGLAGTAASLPTSYDLAPLAL